jgi:hypothetical protein
VQGSQTDMLLDASSDVELANIIAARVEDGRYLFSSDSSENKKKEVIVFSSVPVAYYIALLSL